jgi:hypothetical protein
VDVQAIMCGPGVFDRHRLDYRAGARGTVILAGDNVYAPLDAPQYDSPSRFGLYLSIHSLRLKSLGMRAK